MSEYDEAFYITPLPKRHRMHMEMLQDERLEARDALRAVVSAYDLALKDEQTKIPTPLMCVIENARGML